MSKHGYGAWKTEMGIQSTDNKLGRQLTAADFLLTPSVSISHQIRNYTQGKRIYELQTKFPDVESAQVVPGTVAPIIR